MAPRRAWPCHVFRPIAAQSRGETNSSCLTRTAYWIAFGPHGPRALPPPDEGKKVFLYTLAGLGVSVVIFAILRSFAKPPPHTMTKEWQEASNEYLKVS